MTDNELYTKIIGVLSDETCEKNKMKKFKNLQNELSQLPKNSNIKTALKELCNELEELQETFNYYRQWI